MIENNTEKIHVLVIDPGEKDYQIIQHALGLIRDHHFSSEWVQSYQRGVERIRSGHFDIGFVYYHLDTQTGVDFIKEVVYGGCDQPFILLTDNENKHIDLEALKVGAMDYLVKSDVDSEKLERSIRYSIERAQSLRALKSNEKKFRNIFERSMDTVFTASVGTMRFIDINHAGIDFFGFDKVALLTKSLWEFFDDGDEISAIKKQLVEEGEVNDKEIVLKMESGEKRYCIISLSEELETDQRYYQGIIHDITKLKIAEQETLQNEKLGMADRLMHVLAHEVRNPLNNINLSIEQLSPEIKDSDAEIYVEVISRNSKRISDLITELLNSSRPASIVQKPLSVQQLINRCIDMASDRMKLKHITLAKALSDKDLQIFADEEKMQIAISNIIINAIEAMEEEKGVLKIASSDDDAKIYISITDNGCGISEENMNRLFEPYFTAKRNGMGIGLAATMNILKSHKAKVEVESELNVGTTFTVIFPKINVN